MPLWIGISPRCWRRWLSACKCPCMDTAAATARHSLSGWSSGAPKIATMASPMKLLMYPPQGVMAWLISVRYSLRNATTSWGVIFSDMAVKFRISEKSTATQRVSPPSCSSPLKSFSRTGGETTRPKMSRSRSRWRRPYVIRLNAFPSTPTSSFERTFTVAERSPACTCCAILLSSTSGTVICPEIKTEPTRTRDAASTVMSINRRLSWVGDWARATAVLVSSASTCKARCSGWATITPQPKPEKPESCARPS